MAIFDILTTAATIAKESGKLELQGEILGVYEKLLEQQKKISDLETENRELKQQIKTKENLVFEGNVYRMNDGDKKNGPFCKVCYENEGKMITLNVGDFRLGFSNNPVHHRYHCLVCKNYFK